MLVRRSDWRMSTGQSGCSKVARGGSTGIMCSRPLFPWVWCRRLAPISNTSIAFTRAFSASQSSIRRSSRDSTDPSGAMPRGFHPRLPPHASFSTSSVPRSSRVAGTVPHGCRCCPSWQLPPWLPVLGGRDESAVSGLLSPHAYPAAFRCRHHAWLVSQALALSRCQPKTRRRSVGTRPLDAGAVAHLARGAPRLRAAARGDARALLSRSVGGAASQWRSGVAGVAAKLARPRKRCGSQSRACVFGRWLRSQADVSRANQRNDGGSARHLAHSSNRRVAACDRRRAHTRLGWDRSRRPLGTPGRSARHSRQTAASAVLGLECGDESALLVILPPRSRPDSALPRRAGAVSHRVHRGIPVVPLCARA